MADVHGGFGTNHVGDCYHGSLMADHRDDSGGPATRRNYGRVGRLYEWMAREEQGGLPSWKAEQVERLRPGERVLYAGVGPGFDALAAAAKGCDVTCIDLATNMLRRCEARFGQAGLTGRFIVGSVLEHDQAADYDAVVANFFLNIFEPAVMRRMLGHLVALLRPGGVLMIGDFRPGRGWGLTELWARVNYRIAILFFGAFGLSPWQAMHDYRPLLEDLGLRIESVQDYRGLAWLPKGYRGIVARK